MLKMKPAMMALSILLVALDIVTKQWALRTLDGGVVLQLFGGAVPLTLAFNKGAAFSLSLGAASRWIFVALSIGVIAFLVDLFRKTPASDRVRLLSTALVLAGAFGNLIDRVRWDRGVVDFIGPLDLGFMHWPIFNVADMSITCGAVLLGLSFAFEKRESTPEPNA